MKGIISNELLAKCVDLRFKDDDVFSALGLANASDDNSLTFCDDDKYVGVINGNDKVSGVITTTELSKHFKDKAVILSAKPRFDFYTIYNFAAKANYEVKKTVIGKNCTISPAAFVSETNVVIGDNCIIQPNVTILPDVEIGNNCIIQAGAVLGSEGFEYKRIDEEVLPVYHDGKVILHNDVHIGSNTCVDKGFSFRQTIIHDGAKIDNLIHIAHGVHVGKNTFVIASAMVAGSVTLGDSVWIGPNANIAPGLTIEDEAFITLGSVVTKSVKARDWVTGNFAIPHGKFLKNLKKSIQND